MIAGGATSAEYVVPDGLTWCAAALSGAASQMICNNSIENAATAATALPAGEATVSAKEMFAALPTISRNGQYSELPEPLEMDPCPIKEDTHHHLTISSKVDTLPNKEATIKEATTKADTVIDLIHHLNINILILLNTLFYFV